MLYNFERTLMLMRLLYNFQEKYYKKRIEKGVVKEEDMELYLFASKPSSGAAIFNF